MSICGCPTWFLFFHSDNGGERTTASGGKRARGEWIARPTSPQSIAPPSIRSSHWSCADSYTTPASSPVARQARTDGVRAANQSSARAVGVNGSATTPARRHVRSRGISGTYIDRRRIAVLRNWRPEAKQASRSSTSRSDNPGLGPTPGLPHLPSSKPRTNAEPFPARTPASPRSSAARPRHRTTRLNLGERSTMPSSQGPASRPNDLTRLGPALSSAMLRITDGLDVKNVLGEVVESARSLTGALRHHCHRRRRRPAAQGRQLRLHGRGGVRADGVGRRQTPL